MSETITDIGNEVSLMSSVDPHFTVSVTPCYHSDTSNTSQNQFTLHACFAPKKDKLLPFNAPTATLELAPDEFYLGHLAALGLWEAELVLLLSGRCSPAMVLVDRALWRART